MNEKPAFKETVPDWTLRYEGTDDWTLIVNEFHALMEKGKVDKARRVLEVAYNDGIERERAGNYLALCLQKGWFGYKLPERAVGIFEEMAMRGFAPAMYNLGTCYYYGDGVEKNELRAFQWFWRASQKGDARAKLALGCELAFGTLLETDYTEAGKYLKEAAALGEEEAVSMLELLSRKIL